MKEEVEVVKKSTQIIGVVCDICGAKTSSQYSWPFGIKQSDLDESKDNKDHPWHEIYKAWTEEDRACEMLRDNRCNIDSIGMSFSVGYQEYYSSLDIRVDVCPKCFVEKILVMCKTKSIKCDDDYY